MSLLEDRVGFNQGASDPMASLKQSSGPEFFNKRLKKENSGSRLQRHQVTANHRNAGASLPAHNLVAGGQHQNAAASGYM